MPNLEQKINPHLVDHYIWALWIQFLMQNLEQTLDPHLVGDYSEPSDFNFRHLE